MSNLVKSVLLVISMSSTAMAQLVPGPRPAPYPGGGGGTVAPAPGSGGYLVPGPRPPMPPPGGPGWGGHHPHPRPPMPPPPGGPGWGGHYPPPPPPPMYPPRPPMPPPPQPYPSPYPSPYPTNPYPAPNPGYRQTINLNVYRSVFGNDRIDLTQYVDLWRYRGYRIEQVIVQGSTRWNSAVVTLLINGFNQGSLQFMSQYSQQQSLWLNQMPMIGSGADSLVLYTSGDMTVENVILVIR